MKHSYFVIGSNDEYFDDKTQEELITYYTSIGFEIKRYNGKHDINMDTLTQILSKTKLI